MSNRKSMYDIHTHLYWHTYDADRDAVLERARAAGVTRMFVIGCTVEESWQSVALAEQHPDIFAAVGIHPHEFKTSSDKADIVALREMAQSSKKVVAIGECGLDYYVRPEANASQQAFVGRHAHELSDETKAAQHAGLMAQLDLARELALPVIVHCRDAYEDMFTILKEYPDIPAFILHCYMGDTVVTEQFLTLPNVHFSFTANITYPVKKSIIGTKDDLTETVKQIPLECMFTETDCPFLAPQEKRGERNEPAYVRAVVNQVALLHGVPVDQVERTIEGHFKKVFPRLS